MEKLSGNYEEDVHCFDELIGVNRSCDIVSRDFVVGGKRARIWFVDGFGKDEILERMASFWLALPIEAVLPLGNMQDFIDRCVTFFECDVSEDTESIITSVFLGKSLLLVEGLQGAALIDAKSYPGRSVEEPADGKVLRGAHDGFIEAVVPNMALLRRRIRDPHLTMEGFKVGTRSHNDAILCYLDDKVDRALLEQLRQKLQKIDMKSLSMGQESVAEAIRPKQWLNPFPKVRYTERPDTASASIMEGSIILMVDNSPSVMILPTTFFDFTQEANEFYFPPMVGTYLRLLRIVVFLISLFITPAWYLMVSEPGRLPNWLEFLSTPEPVSQALELFGELLDEMEKLMERLVKEFDFIVVDMPPVNVVTDAIVTSRYTDGTMVVARQDYTDRRSLDRCVKYLKVLEPKLMGFVLTDADEREKGYGQYGYGTAPDADCRG